MADADRRLAELITPAVIGAILDAVPDDWLEGGGVQTYRSYLTGRLAAPRAFAAEAERARGGR